MNEFNESELNDMVKAYVETHCTEDQAHSMNEKIGGFSDWDWISQLFDLLPEDALWQILRGAIATRAQLSDEVIMNLDDSMQGQLFFESHVLNRRSRIDFACGGDHLIYLREAAGTRNVWMNDEEFTRLVELNDSITFACFARCEQMKPHHLLFIQHKLAQDPHQSGFLASSYDAKITLMKALEVQGNSQELNWMRQVLEGLLSFDGCPGSSSGSLPGPRNTESLWRNYLNIKNKAATVAPGALQSMKESPPKSTPGPVRASANGRHLLN
jgi:hypothetical protein